jgi:transcriptional regulator with XRE-family HTH domain
MSTRLLLRVDGVTNNSNALGEFLRARRDLANPERAGVAPGGTRRVPGLRREEVAMLAGVSADYYLRLERGRDRNPSPQVLDAIARVLQLDDDHRDHMFSLVTESTRKAQRPRRRTIVPPGANKLLASLTQPAFIEDQYFDIVAVNHSATALSPGLRVGGNQLLDLFLDPAIQAFHPDWEDVTECFVSNLRHSVGAETDDPRFVEIAGQLALSSARFRRLWARHEVRSQRGTQVRIDHPLVGQLTLNRERLTIAATRDPLMPRSSRCSPPLPSLPLLVSTTRRLGRRKKGSEVVSRRTSDRRRAGLRAPCRRRWRQSV